MKPFTILFLFISLLLGCQYDPFAGDLTVEKPKEKDIIGVYKFESQTIGHSLDNTAKDATIALNADGSFKVTYVPDLDNALYQKRVSATGNWNIETIGSVDNGSGIKRHWGIRLSSLPESLTYIGFIGHSPPYKLIITHGDPDEGAVVIFSKR